MKLSHVRSLTVVGGFKAFHSIVDKFQILQVLDLEGCKDLSGNQLKKVCNMHPLKYLSLRRTDIEEIPSKIARLEFLEVLDIRETKVRKLPASVESLQRMTHLLAGDKSKRIALKLTLGITKMTALQTLSGVEICGSSARGITAEEKVKKQEAEKKKEEDIPLPTSVVGATGAHEQRKGSGTVKNKEQRPVAALENLTSLKKFTIYRLKNFTKHSNLLLLSVIEHLSSCSLKFLEIDDDFSGFLDSSLKSSQAPPEHLQTLGLSGKLSQVPNWIGSLHNLEKLTLSLTSLSTETLNVLAGLPELFSLIFSLDAAKGNQSVLKILHDNALKTEGTIFVPPGFKKLKMLLFVAPVLPPLSFLEGAMPELQRIELRFRMIEGLYGLENLERLQQVFLSVSSQAPNDAKAKASQIKIDLFINGIQDCDVQAADQETENLTEAQSGTGAETKDDVQAVDEKLVKAATQIQSTGEIEEV
ncbi:hypothetical protein EJB05_26759, partial [Eragrostis curvula]